MNEPSTQPDNAAGQMIPPAGPVVNPAERPEADESTKKEFLWNTHNYLNEYARFADTKAAFSGTISGAVLGYLCSANAFTPLVTSKHAGWTTAAWLAAAAGVTLCASVVFAIWTVMPRLKSTQTVGYIYWGNVAAFSEVETLKRSFHAQSGRALDDHLINHIFDLAKHVCVPKYRAVRICLLMLLVGSILGATSLLLQDCTSSKGSSSVSGATVQSVAPEPKFRSETPQARPSGH